LSTKEHYRKMKNLMRQEYRVSNRPLIYTLLAELETELLIRREKEA